MHIVFAIDGSKRALDGARLLASLPLGPNSSVTILGVAPIDHGTPEELRNSLDVARETVKACGARIVRRMCYGHPADEILREAEKSGAALIVLGAAGQSNFSRLLLGSVSGRVSRHARCSLLIARPLSENIIRSVIIGVDGSISAEYAVQFMATFPLSPDCRIRLVTVVLPVVTAANAAHQLIPHVSDEVRALSRHARAQLEASLDKADHLLRSQGYRCVTSEIRSGDAASEIIAVAEEEQADLVVVGARGLSAADRFLLGSVSERILRHVPCSVLCVRSPSDQDGKVNTAVEKVKETT